MADINKASWWIAATAILIAFFALWLFFKPHPPPGDPIVVQPDPVDPSNVNSAYVTIGGSDPVPQYEPPNVKYLNKNAFPKIKEFYARARKTPSDPTLKITLPDEVKASFGHCSDLSASVFHACGTNADCLVSGTTCVVSTMRVTKQVGTPNKFRWFLQATQASPDEIELVPHNYNDSTKWRAEFCGRLVGDITVTFNGTTYVVPTGNTAWIWAEP